MKTLICLFVVLGYAFSLPSSIDWSKVKPNLASLDPVKNISHPSARIIGGNEAEPNSRPFQVALARDDSNQFCSGLLISADWVLTAAHCMVGASRVFVILGAHRILQVEPSQVVIISRDIILHPDFDPATLKNDIALMRLSQSVAFNDVIQPVDLPSTLSGTFAGSSAVLSGWGQLTQSHISLARTLQILPLRVITNIACARTYGISSISLSVMCTSGYDCVIDNVDHRIRLGKIWDDMELTAGSCSAAKNTWDCTCNVGGCNGDGGSPLTVKNKLVGITSFISSQGCEAGSPTGYTRVSFYRRWIRQTTGV
ncbi:hypothetical protein NQ318_022823 [Aromia moschata]|uniref:Peptidase S1 domain-containing protein n=1 Tax=Aromia moschata TaxID=1265417 RepID=A0AAV8XWE0_9CUCU|nr:hypothetical protein NQ318_022823 [Aromia moschata]